MAHPAEQTPWKAREIRLLGSRPDAEVARLIGRTEVAVELKRRKLGIEAPLQPAWTADEIKQLGTRPDREIARIIGRSTQAVQIKRFLLKIKSWQARNLKERGPVEPEKVKLLFGPYSPPRTRRGKFLFCELRGTIKVGEYSDGPIPWPMKWRTRSLILCGDLVRAVREESALAVAHHWAVCTHIVSRWRGVLEAGPYTTGTRRLRSFLSSDAMTPTLRAHLSRLKTGKPRKVSKKGEARILAAVRRPKSQRWHQSMARHFAARRGKPVDPADRAWMPEEEALLGTQPDRKIARQLERTVGAVRARRQLKGIPNSNPEMRRWTKEEIGLLGKFPDHEVAERTGHTLKSVQQKRQILRRLLRPSPKPWRPEEERLLGTKPDTEVAILLKRSRQEVRRHRLALGIEPAVARPAHRAWKPGEDKLLGTAPDSAIARRLGRSHASVQLRRLGLGLVSHRKVKQESPDRSLP